MNGSTPSVRVTWSTTVPTDCVTLVTVKFKLNATGNLASAYNTNNTSGTEIIQTGLQCNTNYYVRVVVTGKPSDGQGRKQIWKSSQLQVLVGGI